jgi:ketopantoate hydroxymethyltransferase
MHDYKVEVTRDGRWWMINVPDIDQITQARRVSEIEDMARSLIAISTDTPLKDVKVNIASIDVPEVGDVGAAANEIRKIRAHAVHVEAEAISKTTEYAKRMAAAGVPVRDIAELLGMSPQRVSQLANAS